MLLRGGRDEAKSGVKQREKQRRECGVNGDRKWGYHNDAATKRTTQMTKIKNGAWRAGACKAAKAGRILSQYPPTSTK